MGGGMGGGMGMGSGGMGGGMGMAAGGMGGGMGMGAGGIGRMSSMGGGLQMWSKGAQDNEALPITLRIEKQLVGAIIGKKGAKVNEIQATTGASVSISNSRDSEESESVVTLKGSAQANSAAYQLIAAIVQEAKMQNRNRR